MSYKRVIPRDFFNEAKLLKCMGRLCIMAGETASLKGLSIKVYNQKGAPFRIHLDGITEELSLINYTVRINRKRIPFYTRYNAQSPYPFYCMVNGNEVEVFDAWGGFTDEFRALKDIL